MKTFEKFQWITIILLIIFLILAETGVLDPLFKLLHN